MEKENGFYPELDDEFPVNQFFGKNVYVREFNMRAGTFVTGRVHKRDHVFTLVKGDILIWDYFRGIERFQGYVTFEAKAGTKRAIIAFEDTIILTQHYVEDDITSEDARERLSFFTQREFLEYSRTGDSLIGDKGGIAPSGLQSGPRWGEWSGPDTLAMPKNALHLQAQGSAEPLDAKTLIGEVHGVTGQERAEA